MEGVPFLTQNNFLSCSRAEHLWALVGDKERASVSTGYYTRYNHPSSPECLLSLQIESKDPRGWSKGKVKFEGQAKGKGLKYGVLPGKRRPRRGD